MQTTRRRSTTEQHNVISDPCFIGLKVPYSTVVHYLVLYDSLGLFYYSSSPTGAGRYNGLIANHLRIFVVEVEGPSRLTTT
jgi:hypothetical protein